MEIKLGQFSFKIPEGKTGPNGEKAGTKIVKPFEYPVTDNDDEAQNVLIEKKWSLKELVDEALKSNARANEYNKALAPYQDTMSPEKTRERMIKDYIRMGFAENKATAMVDAALAQLAAENQ